MTIARPILSLISLLILAGGIVMQFLVILSGGVSGSPVNLIYFLQVDTSQIQPTPRNPTRWTFFALTGAGPNGKNADYGSPRPALPFDPPRNFGTEQGVPEQFIGTNHYYYLSRFMFAFYLIALFFAVCALFTGLLALCSRLGGYISGFTVSIALFFQTITAALMTAWTVQGRNAFRSNGMSAQLGKYAYGLTWAAMACFLISTILFCCGGKADGSSSSKQKSRFGGGLRRKRSTRSRGSFIDTEDGSSRVKDDYA